MLIPAFVEDIKKEINKKTNLQLERRQITSSIKKGASFFRRTDLTNEKAQEGLQLASEYLNRLEEIDNELTDIDIIIATKLEAFLGDFVIKGKLQRKTNDAGDIVESEDIVLAPYKSSDSSYIELVPDDIWFLKIIKKALAIKNVEVISKQQYYKNNNNGG